MICRIPLSTQLAMTMENKEKADLKLKLLNNKYLLIISWCINCVALLQ